MKSPREYYKEQHPSEFSDSQLEEVTDFDREVINHALTSITTNNQEQSFERFCFRVCEERVCANLIPNTGPAGGGDGKVDADTFPVADSHAYFDGVGRQTTNERWAFAISAKQAWKQKVQSDVKSILSTGRPYGRIIFVTNQAVPSKDRQKAQDELTTMHGLPISILDRTWLIDSIMYHNCARFAIEELGFNSAKKFNVLPGPRDQKKRQRLTELVSQLESESESNPTFLSVENALLAAKLARSLEQPRPAVESLFEKAGQYAATLGTDAQRIEVEYQLAWTQFWWYEDFATFLLSYQAFIESLGSNPSFETLSKWRNLWQVVQVALRETKGNSKLGRTKELLAAVEACIAHSVAGSSSELNARFLKLQLLVYVSLHKKRMPSTILATMAGDLQEAARHLGFDFEGFIQWIEAIAEVIPTDPSFESLYDRAAELRATREGEVSAAKMQLDRAETLVDSGNSREAVVRLCRAHAHLLKHETRSECIHCLFLLGNMYLRLGLTWAARAAFIAASAIGLQYLATSDELHPGLRISLAHLRICSVALGLVGESLAWHELTRVFQSVTYQRTGVDRIIRDEEAKFEILLGRLLLRIPTKSRAGLEPLPAVLDNLDLPVAADLARVKLGAELSILEYMPKPPKGSLLDGIYHIEADDLRLSDIPADIPWEPTSLATTLFGCRFQFEFENSDASRHLAEVLLALIEPIFATATVGDVFAFQERVVVRLHSSGSSDANIELLRLETDAHVDFSITHGDSVAKVLWSEPGTISQKLVESALVIGFGSFMSDAVIKALEEKSDASLFERSYSVSRSISDMKYVVGDLEDLELLNRLRKSKGVFPISAEKWEPSNAEPVTPKRRGRKGDAPRSDEDFRKSMATLSHSEIIVVSPIRSGVWDAAGWFGVLFAWSPYEPGPPVLAFGFDNAEAGRAIMEGWRQTYGDQLQENIRISMIRGISRQNPFHYRVLISGQLPTSSAQDTRFIQSVVRVHTMLADSPQNLQGFLDMFEFHGSYVLSVAGRNVDTSEGWSAVLANGILMREVVVRQAWEIGRHDPDMAGVLPDDDVIIPDNVENPPVIELLAWKRARKGEESS
ncbi:MAG: hypothetical protein ABL949_06170 [Fimbriimonadaceae bacterium]